MHSTTERACRTAWRFALLCAYYVEITQQPAQTDICCYGTTVIELRDHKVRDIGLQMWHEYPSCTFTFKTKHALTCYDGCSSC